MIRSFRDLKVWEKGIEITETVYHLTKKSDFSKDFALRDQVRRAAVSIPSNIAEGYERKSGAEFRKFLLYSLGSAAELITQMEIAKRLKYIIPEEKAALENTLVEISKMIHSLRDKVKKGLENV